MRGIRLMMFDFELQIMQAPPLIKRENPAFSTQETDIKVNAM
jgi:hypothetical protein